MARIAKVQIVAELERAREPLAEVPPKEAFRMIGGFDPEACSQYHGRFVAVDFHAFIATFHLAFCSHRPVIVSPDHFWLMILQGLARHIHADAEKYRHLFVRHEGKQSLSIRRDDFIPGSPENPWSEAVAEFSDLIRDRIGDENFARIMARFSTTGAVEKTVFEMTLMNVTKSYFDYSMSTKCGIPEVILEGSAEDWESLPARAAALGLAYDMKWWTDVIVPILERIARNAAGSDDPDLWKNVYKIGGESGGPYYNGWITDFVPYVEVDRMIHVRTGLPYKRLHEYAENPGDYTQVRILERNPLLGKEPSYFQGLTDSTMPSGLSRVPFEWNVLGGKREMELVGGFFAIEQRAEDLALKPKIGWAIRDMQRS